MDEEIFYFDVQHAVAVHDWIIDNSGGLPGTREIGLLESVLDHIQNDIYYPGFEEKLNHLVFSINKSHAFNDGNKRASLTLGRYFLKINGYEFCAQKFFLEMENIVVWLAEGKISKELLQRLISSLILDEEYPEELKLELVTAVSEEQ